MVNKIINIRIVVGVIVLTGSYVLANCPLELTPPRALVRYGDPVSVSCNTSSVNNDGMGWEATKGSTGLVEDVSVVTWKVASLEDWTVSPKCYINPSDLAQCSVTLPVTLYKLPDNVYVSLLNHTNHVKEGGKYQLQCEVVNVAPAQNLTVTWFKGSELIQSDNSHVPDRTPVNQSFTLTFTASRNDSQFTCVAQLNLDLELKKMQMAENLAMNVLFPPSFLNPEPEQLDLQPGEEITLNCNASGNPTPDYFWESSEDLPEMSDEVRGVLTSSSLPSGTYTCTASNTQGRVAKQFVVNYTGNRNTFWAIIGSFLCLGLIITIGYVIVKMKCSPNSII